MKAMILAAGRGNRMRPLSDKIPKPLLQINGKALIEYHLYALAKMNVRDVVINVAYGAKEIMKRLGNGERYGLTIHFSYEKGEVLGTGGGIFQALPLLGQEPFMLLSADIWTDYPINTLPTALNSLAHLVLIPTPENYAGDFYLKCDLVKEEGSEILTFGGMAVIHPDLFKDCKPVESSLNPLFRCAIKNNLVTGECYRGKLINITTPQELEMISTARS